MSAKDAQEIKKAVREHYGTAIKQQGSCCSPTPQTFDPEAAGRFANSAGYSADDLKTMPDGVTSFGCGNPINFMDVKPGDTVLDLGSGSGLDLILAARKVGPTGKAIGLDMTPEMIDTCRDNIKKAGLTNAEVRMGEMEAMPVADSEVDWIISNCVINLSPEKEKVFAESFRVLKPGGKVMVSDIVASNLSDEMRSDMAAWVGCISGAVDEEVYLQMMRDAGFSDVKVVDKMNYDAAGLNALANDSCCGDVTGNVVKKSRMNQIAGKVASVRVFAQKPA